MKIRALGRVGYEATWQQMREFTDARTAESEDELWIVEHDPVFTQGIAGKPEHLLINPANIPIVKTDRGGQITYHGPGQTVVYVMFDLKRAGCGVRELVVRIENAVIALLKEFGVEAFGKRDAPGVYVNYSLSRSAGAGWGEGGGGNTSSLSDEASRGHSLSRSAGEGWGEGGFREKALRILPAKELPEDLKRLARAMRANDTDAENRIWYFLRNRQMNGRKFRRQHPVGRFILDFYCDELRLAVELDGGQHAERIAEDSARTARLNEQGISVIRFWNEEVFNNLDGVLYTIYSKTVAAEINELTPPIHLQEQPSPQPSPARVSDRDLPVKPPQCLVVPPSPQPSPALREREPLEAKIASLGLKIRNGRSYHGVALNVNMDLTPFSFINPCGYEGLRVTHLHDFGVDLPANDVGTRLSAHLVTALSAPA